MLNAAHTRIARTLTSAFACVSMVLQPAAAYDFRVPLDPPSSVSGDLTFSDDYLQFGGVAVNSSATQVVTVTNTGGDPVALSGITASGAGFSATNTCGALLAPAASCTITPKFAPTASGFATGNVTVASTDTAGERTIVLKGKGLAGSLTVSGWTFPDPRQVGDELVYKDLEVVNNSSSPVDITGISVAMGEDSFGQSNGCLGLLLPSGRCNIRVSFSPSSAGTKQGAVAIASDSDESPNIIALSGQGQAPAGTLQVASFGAIQIGDSIDRLATVTNTGVGPLSVQGTAVTGTDYAATANSCAPTLAPGSSCTFGVRFTAQAAGARTGQASATTNAGTLTANFDGTGQSPSAVLTVPAFGDVNLGQSVEKKATLKNAGAGVLTLQAPSVTGTGFSLNGTTCAGQLAAGATCEISVLFAPQAHGGSSGTLSVQTGAGAQSASLNGTGFAPVLNAAPSSVQFGDVVVGNSVDSAGVTLTNTGNLAATNLQISLPQGVTLAPSSGCSAGTSLAAGSSCTAVLRFQPSAAMSYAGTVSASTSAATGSTASIAVAGKGIRASASLSASELSFAVQQVGTSSTPKSVTVTNNGTSTLSVSSVTVSSGATDFSAVASGCASIAVGGSCTISVTFTPTTTGARTGTLSLVHNGEGATTVSLAGDGQAASASLTPGAFAATQVGSSTTATTVLRNTGSGSLSLTAPSAASVAGAAFAFVSTTCSNTLAAAASCDIVVKFTPTTAGARTATVSVPTQVGTQSASLNAMGLQGSLSADTASLAFAAQQTATASAVKTVTLTNEGTAPVNFTSVSLASGASDYSQTNTCTTAAVVAGGTCTISVTFTPSTTGSRPGSLSLVHNGTGVTAVSLSGTGQGASASLAAATFANTNVGSSVNAVATLTNTGIGSITLTTPTASTVTGSDYSFVSTTCGASLAAGTACDVLVKFQPSSAGSRPGAVTLNTQVGTKNVALSAVGIQGSASVSPTSLSFASQQTATSSAVKTVTVTNTGTSTLSVSAVALPAGSEDFSQTNNCTTAPLAVGGTCTISVTYTPRAAGPSTGTLNLTHNGTGATSVGLSGTGQAAGASLSTPSFGSPAVGSSANATATLSNTGIGNITVTAPTTGSVTGTDFSFVSSDCPATLGAGLSCSVVVKFSPTATTARSGSLSVVTSAGTKSVSLGSTGIQGFASISPGSLTFVPQQVGTTSAIQQVTVTNTGSNTLTFTGVSISTGNAHFGQNNNCAAVPVSGTCTVNVTFTPSAVGNPLNGTLSFAHNGGGTASVTLTGSSQAASATLSVPSFASTPVGSSSTATATLANTGIGPIAVTPPADGSVTGADFSFVSTTCTATLSVGSDCAVVVKFSPPAVAASTGTLTVATGAGTKTAALASTAIQGKAALSATGLTFAAQQVGTSSVAQTVTLTNTGTNTLDVSDVSVTAGAAHYVETSTCGTVAVNGTCTVSVTFKPTAASASLPGTVTLTHNGRGSTSFTLAGSSQPASATITSNNWTTPVQVGSTSGTG